MATRNQTIAHCASVLPASGATATQIAKLTGYTPQSVRRIMADAVDYGLIYIRREPYRKNVDRLIYLPNAWYLQNKSQFALQVDLAKRDVAKREI